MLNRIGKVLPLAIILPVALTLNVHGVKVRESASEYYESKCVVRDSGALFYDDFTAAREEQAPRGYSIINSGGEVQIEKIKTPTAKKNSLKILDDIYNGSLVSLERNFTPQSKVSVEIRFKLDENLLEKNTAAFNVSFMKDGIRVADFIKTAATNSWNIGNGLSGSGIWNTSSADMLAKLAMQPGVWYTVGLYVDAAEKKADFKIESAQVAEYTGTDSPKIRYDTEKGIVVGKGFDVNPTFSGDTVNALKIWTSGSYSGRFFIDYIKITGNAQGFDLIKPKPLPIIAPMVPDPVQRAIPNRVNIMVEGEYVYYTEYPTEVDGVTMAQCDKTLSALGFTVDFDGQTITAQNDDSSLQMTIGSAVATLNSQSINISPPVAMSGSAWIPIAQIAKLLGYTVEETKDEEMVTVFIRRGEL